MNPLTSFRAISRVVLLLGLLVVGRLSAAPVPAKNAQDSTVEACCDSHDSSALPCVTVPMGHGNGGSGAFVAAATPPPPSAIGVKRILLYRVDFSDSVGAAITSNTAATLIADLNN